MIYGKSSVEGVPKQWHKDQQPEWDASNILTQKLVSKALAEKLKRKREPKNEKLKREFEEKVSK